MQCPQCRAENPERARFCEDCGARLEFRCPHCGEAATPGKKFCASCGGSLVTATATPRPAPSPHEYTPQHLAERILTSRTSLEGERKQVTVLFADLKGSMELLADRDPEEARAILDPVLERMMETVHRYEGTVNQVMGDGIMALFGAPLALEDHAVRACYAALRMQESVKQYSDDIWRSQNVRIQIRVGLNSGEVVVRSIGSDLRMEYTAVGQTTHLAARMEQLATPGSILLAPDTLQLAEGYVQVKALGPVQVKGLSELVEVYELVGSGTARSRLQAAAARGLTKFVGRDAELETLRRALEQAGSGHGQLVALVGEPGVGKSRLVWEFSHSHRTQGWLVLEGGSVSYGKATSYLPVIDLLKGYCGIEDRDDARRIREKLTGKLLTLDPALQPTLPAFLSLLDSPVDEPAWQALDPPQRRGRTLDACKRLLLRESQEQPLLLVFEDLHWIDTETHALLDIVVDSLPTARILLLVNYRPEYEHAWHRKTYYQQLRLDPLPPESAEELLAGLLGAEPALDPLKRSLVERTEGNPFFLEESVRTLVETGALAGERGAYRLAKPLAKTQVPATVQAVLAARIDRLAPEDKRLLQAAAVIGKDVLYSLLEVIAEEPQARLMQGLTGLQAAEFLYEGSLFPELEYTFKHALTHEVAYGSLLQERRRALHVQIVAAIEALYPGRLAEYVELLAHHAQRGEAWDKAVAYLRQAAAKAHARCAFREAATYLEQALGALAHLPDSRGARELAVDIRFDLHNALWPLAEREELGANLRELERLTSGLEDLRRRGRAVANLTRHFVELDDYDRAIEYGQHVLAIAADLDEVALAVPAHLYLGRAYYALGHYVQAMDVLRRNLVFLVGDRSKQRFGLANYPSIGSLFHMSVCLAERGEFTEAMAEAEEALRLAEAVGDPFSLVAGYLIIGSVRLHRGDAQASIEVLEQALELCRAAHVPLLLPPAAAVLGRAYALSGRIAEALPVLEEAVEQGATRRATMLQTTRLAWLGEAYLQTGRAEHGAGFAARALALARANRERGSEAWALRLLGETAAHADSPDVDQAETHYRQALALADELGMRPLVAHCHLGLGTLYQMVGRAEQAQAELSTAAELYRAMEMPYWLEQTQAALGSPAV